MGAYPKLFELCLGNWVSGRYGCIAIRITYEWFYIIKINMNIIQIDVYINVSSYLLQFSIICITFIIEYLFDLCCNVLFKFYIYFSFIFTSNLFLFFLVYFIFLTVCCYFNRVSPYRPICINSTVSLTVPKYYCLQLKSMQHFSNFKRNPSQFARKTRSTPSTANAMKRRGNETVTPDDNSPRYSRSCFRGFF